jgi:hypothetical protein
MLMLDGLTGSASHTMWVVRPAPIAETAEDEASQSSGGFSSWDVSEVDATRSLKLTSTVCESSASSCRHARRSHRQRFPHHVGRTPGADRRNRRG